MFYCGFSQAQENSRAIRIGLLSTSVHDVSIERFLERTISLIKMHLEGYRVEVIPCTADGLREEIANKKVDYTISDSFFYLSESASAGSNGLGRIASVLTDKSTLPNQGIGGALIRKKQFAPVLLEHLEGKSIAIPRSDDYYGWGALQREILDAGYSPKNFFSRKVFTNSSLDETVLAVLNGDTDLGIIHTCYLEDHKDDPRLNDLEVISPKNINGFNCKTTTRLYLGWVFAATPANDPDITRLVVRALLDIPESNGSRWIFGGDFTENHSLFKELDAGQYSQLNRLAFTRFIRENLVWFLFLIFFIAGLILHSVRTNHLVDVRTSALRKTQKERTDLMVKLSDMQRIGVVGLMSSTLAHELKQPIGAIRNYLQGLKFQLKLGSISNDSLSEAVQEMESQVLRANSIIEKVRGYAKDKKSAKTKINMSALLRDSAINLAKTKDNLPRILIHTPRKPVYVEGDRTELELAIHNVLKNALEACQDVRNPKVSARIIPNADIARIEISDNGPVLNDEDFNALGTPLKTTKESGLGLGLPIVKQITEAHRGKLTFERIDSGGMRATIQLPVFKEPQDV